MFSSLGLFKQVACPEQPQCTLPNCIFAHSLLNNAVTSDQKAPSPALDENVGDQQNSRPPKKKRRTDEDHEEAGTNRRFLATAASMLPETASRDVSPPPLRGPRRGYQVASSLAVESVKRNPTSPTKANVQRQSASKPVEVSLNPRMLPKPPAPHAVRLQLITMLHEHMQRLNEEIKKSDHPSKTSVQLPCQALITQALNEEEKIAQDSPSVYQNIIKLRIVKLKKMKLNEWIEERITQIAKPLLAKSSTETNKAPKVIETGLTPIEEIVFLPELFADQSKLSRHGYVTALASEAEVEEARTGIEAAQGWEQCDRCKTRFQVFPGRREEDGALTSGGQCVHHPGKARKATAQDKANKASRESFYTCCHEAIGTSSGCATAPTHVFKISEAKRLALVMPFEKTPSKLMSPGPKTAVCFDCEMGYTTEGLELIRLTATSWPRGDLLIDVLVRPIGQVLDLNSQYSGVWPKDFADALPFKSDAPTSTTPTNNPEAHAIPLRIVSSPAAARSLLFTFLTPETPLIGHALDNDLNTTRIIHPSLVDTVLLYPHPKGLPIRFGLKALMKKHLDRDIQMGGAAGHDSKEDAKAAGELVRLKVAERWRAMKRDGWTVRLGEFLPPVPGAATMAEPFGGYVARA